MAVTRRDQNRQLANLASNGGIARVLSLLASASKQYVRSRQQQQSSRESGGPESTDWSPQQTSVRARTRRRGRGSKQGTAGVSSSAPGAYEGPVIRIPGNFLNARKVLTITSREMCYLNTGYVASDTIIGVGGAQEVGWISGADRVGQSTAMILQHHAFYRWHRISVTVKSNVNINNNLGYGAVGYFADFNSGVMNHQDFRNLATKWKDIDFTQGAETTITFQPHKYTPMTYTLNKLNRSLEDHEHQAIGNIRTMAHTTLVSTPEMANIPLFTVTIVADVEMWA